MELLDREPGWLDGKGVPPTSEVLQLTRLYASSEGGVEAKWRQLDLDSGMVVEPRVLVGFGQTCEAENDPVSEPFDNPGDRHDS